MLGRRLASVCLACVLLGVLPAAVPAQPEQTVDWQIRAVESLPLRVIGGDANRARWTRDDTVEVLFNNPVGLAAYPIFLGIRKLVRDAKTRRTEATASPDVEAMSPSLEAIQAEFAANTVDLATDAPPAPINDVMAALATALQQQGAQIDLALDTLPLAMEDADALVQVEHLASRWYRSEQALPMAREDGSVAAGVLEIGMLRYRLKGGDKLLLEIGIKHIDPVSGRVFGRAKAVNTWQRPRASRHLPDLVEGSEEFDLALQDLSNGLVMACLQQLALPSADVEAHAQVPAGTSHSNAAPSTKR